MSVFIQSCASCRHWMIGSTSYRVRMEAYLSLHPEDWKAVCHVRQPKETGACFSCCQHERALLGE